MGERLDAFHEPEVARAEGKLAADLRNRGAYVFPGAIPSASVFAEIYRAFDRLAALLVTHAELAAAWRGALDAWLGVSDNATYFCGVPLTYRDRRTRPGKRNKEYLHLTPDFVEFLVWSRFGELAQGVYDPMRYRNAFDELQDMHWNLGQIELLCRGLFSMAVQAVCPKQMSRLLPPGSQRTPIVFKLIKYYPSRIRFGTDPHYDKSVFSLLLHADDRKVSYRLGEWRPGPVQCSTLLAPIDYPGDAEKSNDAVLIAGAMLRASGMSDIGPTPHMVLPVAGNRPRHSIIAFLVAPGFNTRSLDSSVDYLNDYVGGVT